MRIIVPIIIFIAVTLTLTWILVFYVNLPAELLPLGFSNTIKGTSYIELQLLYLLGGDPLHTSNPYLKGLLLNFEAYPYFNIIVWFTAGVIAGFISDSFLKSALTGLNSGILLGFISWVIYWGVLYGFEISSLITSSTIYQLSFYVLGGLKCCWIGVLGGLTGFFIRRRTGR
ncbi:MAG: hypothetical protein OdinLCB4_000840 [Candidatus Odinarchaeum yellowstonii]|uniref:Uncharacterized protein n=1 Tax=Odinarchaeota yellowstonii (strain LCB_4) TaxID=1841599 RepID=A0AAF0IBL3_ODILC|nr:MAG: hypothetical protein OdinLCB4_000840 [Candidatus Odinarchaeum yellowstonii]